MIEGNGHPWNANGPIIATVDGTKRGVVTNEQDSNALSPILNSPDGNVIVEIPFMSENALTPIVFRFDGRTSELNPPQS